MKLGKPQSRAQRRASGATLGRKRVKDVPGSSKEGSLHNREEFGDVQRHVVIQRSGLFKDAERGQAYII